MAAWSHRLTIMCIDGCGNPARPGRKFLPGHDSKFKSKMGKAESEEHPDTWGFLTDPITAKSMSDLVQAGRGDEIIGGRGGHTIAELIERAKSVRVG